jgi:2-dehydropantoate 2-reductase
LLYGLVVVMTADTILILGTGALATLFAARLSAAGVDVTMLGSWPEGLAALNQRGAELDGRAYPVRATADPVECRGAGSALVLVKAWQTERAAAQLADCLAADGLAVTLQNGLGNAAVLARTLGLTRVAVGVTTLGANLAGPGCVVSGGEGPVTLEAHPRLAGLESMLGAAGFSVNVVADVRLLVWEKLAVNAAINPLTALLRVRNGQLLELPSARRLMGALAGEAAAVAKSLGVLLPLPGPERLAEEVARRTAQNLSSMLQDVLRGTSTEVDAINGAIVREGERHGVPAPVNRALWSLVKAAVHLPRVDEN